MEFKIKIERVGLIAEGTTSVFFEKPVGLEFRAGQFMEWFLPEVTPNDSRGLRREFSIASAPSHDYLEVAFRNGESAFKKALRSFEIGKEIRAGGPYGSFVLPKKTDRPLVLLAGGIGVTPFRSMVWEAQLQPTEHKIKLFHFDSVSSRMPFLDEWQGEWRKEIEIIPVVSDESDVWQGEIGMVSEELLRKYSVLSDSPIFFAAGPPGFVAKAWQVLKKIGVDEDDIRTEEFPGYQ